MKLTKNFYLKEFASKDGAETPCEMQVNLKEVAINLQILRDYFGLPITINSGYRSPAHNRSVGGASKSQHLLGKAADIQISGKNSIEIKNTIEALIREGKMKNGGLSAYPNFVHYDVRSTPARW